MEMKIVIQVPESVEALIKTMLKGSPARVEIAGVESPEMTPPPESSGESNKRRGRPKKSEPAVAPSEPPSSPTTEPMPVEPVASVVTPIATTTPSTSLEAIRDRVLGTVNGIELSKTILAKMGVQKIGELSPEQRVEFVTQLGML